MLILPKRGYILGKKIKLIDDREYTLMLVPHHGQKVRSIRIPMMTVKYTVPLLGVIILFIVAFFVDYCHVRSIANHKDAELELLRNNRDAQVQQIEDLARSATSLQADMERLNSLDTEIKQLQNGVVPASANYKGQGGPQMQFDINQINHLVNDLQVAAKVKEQGLVQIKKELLDKQVNLQSTPSIWPTSGEVTSRFGWRNSPWGGGGDWHPGIDIANSIGTPIVATADGEVVQSEWCGGYGNMVQLNHGNGIATIYGHNSQLLVSVGQVVKKGQVIAQLGSTGNSTGPHVHYEVRVNGTPVNPTNFLK